MSKKEFEEKYQTALDEQKTTQKKFDTISMLRLFTAAAAVIFLCISRNIIFLSLTAVCIIIFIVLMKQHAQTERNILLQKARQNIYKAYADRFSDAWISSLPDGGEFQSSEYPEGRDLDIFGHASLYQFLCMAKTKAGRESLAARLKCTSTEGTRITKRQDAVKEISENEKFRTDFLCAAHGVSDEKCEQALRKTKESKVYPINTFLYFLSWLLPAADILSIILYIFNIYPGITALAALVLTGLQFIISCVVNAHSQDTLGGVSRLKKYVGAYENIIGLIMSEKFTSELLDKERKVLADSDAVEGIRKLSEISDISEVHSNGIAFFLCNAFFMWDIHCMYSYYRWQRKYNKAISQWLDVIGEFEMYISLSVLGDVRENCVYPEITNDGLPYVDFSDLRHPLIDPGKAVGNSATLSSSAVVITGSNMSGKTTFMRSIGICTVLAAAGAMVPAGHFWISQLRVMTSMRTVDDISGGISTFYAELLRIKSMVEYSGTGKPVLLLIDEIFKGTNSKDRIAGAKAAIDRLTGKNAITVITTHDFELCDETKYAAKIINYHFCEQYENDMIRFDYKIRKGRCTTTNAAYLLKMAGITDDRQQSV
ncbi:MAG: hypothetical protein Q4F95_01170 [Oscillospiraceae bacterium]|nr:hypothetical protein [Oscillospiraceae bacterium]